MAGAAITFMVLQPQSVSKYRVVGFDAENLPTPLPVTNVATYPLAHPIQTTGGEVLGLFSPNANANCNFGGGMGDFLGTIGPASAPSQGASYTLPFCCGTSRLNVAADLVQGADVGVTASAQPASVVAGGGATFSFKVSNSGPSGTTVAFNDVVPTGLSVVSASAGSGTCTISGQNVGCAISGPAPGVIVPVDVGVVTHAPGAFQDSGTAASSVPDSNPANNGAAATLTVTAPAAAPGAQCHVPPLKGAPLAVAKTALRALGCNIGRVSSQRSKKIARGLVISTSPGPGTDPAGTAVKIVESSGKPKPKRHKH